MSEKLVYESDRVFSVFGFAMSHGVLLLRSGKSNETPTRVDIMFKDVRAMEIRTWFKGLKVDEVDATYLAGQHSNPEEMLEPGPKVYALTSSGWRGFIMGGIVRFNEDDGDLFDPSAIVEPPPVRGGLWGDCKRVGDKTLLLSSANCCNQAYLLKNSF